MKTGQPRLLMRGAFGATIEGGGMKARGQLPVHLLCASAALAVVLLLLVQRRVADLSAAAAAFPQSHLDLAARLGASPTALSSSVHRIAVLAAALTIVALTAAALILWRRHPSALTTFAFLTAGVQLVSLATLFRLAGDGATLATVWRTWQRDQALLVRHAERDIKFLALGLVLAILLAGAAGTVNFALQQARVQLKEKTA